MRIAVYLGSNPGNDPMFLACAREIGRMIAENGHTLVYGGANDGMMGALADTVAGNGGKAIGVIPEFFQVRAHQGLEKLIVVENMPERKTKMIELADAFIALPGGPGTIEEISEVISAVRIGIFAKPCVIYNLNGYYDPLREMYDRMTECGFLSAGERRRFVFAETMDEIRNALKGVQRTEE